MSHVDEESLGRRIEQLTSEPEHIRAPLVRLMRPIIAPFGFRASISSAKAEELLQCLRGSTGSAEEGGRGDASSLMAKAWKELESNLVSVERATVVHGRVLVSHAAWLRRLYEVLVRCSRAIDAPEDASLRRLATGAPRLVLPPLSIKAAAPGQGTERPLDEGATRLLELELSAVDHVLDAADNEVELLGRKRRLLEAARQVLLDTNAAIALESDGVEARRRHIAAEITRLDRLEASGLSAEVTISHQLREAFDLGERDRVHAALVAIDGLALGAGDATTAKATGLALAEMWGRGDPKGDGARLESLRRSANEVFGPSFVETVGRIYAKARKRYRAAGKKRPSSLASTGVDYFEASNVDRLLSAALATDGSFEVGGALTPMRVTEVERRLRGVRFPTQHLMLVPAEEPADITDAIVEDPRTIVLDLAAGRLLARRFVHEELTKTQRTVMRAEVRVYLLDGSGSMNGPRARMRDAMVAAELLTLKHRLLEGAKLARVVLFYRYFDAVLHDAVRVDSPRGVDEAMVDVLGSVHEGGTDIQGALLGSFEQVRAARHVDPDLAEAQIVLVTDGNAPIDEDIVVAARNELEGLAVKLSVVALGTENLALRQLVARQRARGERCFYHFIPDEALDAMTAGQIDGGLCLHLPRVAEGGSVATMSEELDALVDELTTIGRAREIEALESLETEAEARAEAGVIRASLSDGERARALALYRDRLRLRAQYARWFPLEAQTRTGALDDVPPSDVDATLVVLATVADVVLVTSGSELTRQADAIDLMERLLPDARLTPARYRAVVSEPSPAIRRALEAVHRAVSPPIGASGVGTPSARA